MYEDLIKKLRYCGNAISCTQCPYWEGCTGSKEDLGKVADIIEKLEKAVPRWIPVKEQLPKTRESILGKKSSKVIVAFRFGDGTQGTDTAHTLNGEWVFEDHITVVARTITHWMPLPPPPAVDTEEQP